MMCIDIVKIYMNSWMKVSLSVSTMVTQTLIFYEKVTCTEMKKSFLKEFFLATNLKTVPWNVSKVQTTSSRHHISKHQICFQAIFNIAKAAFLYESLSFSFE